MIELNRFRKSLKHAIRGVKVVFVSEQSFRIQLFIGVLVLCLGVIFQVRPFEWIVLLLLVGSVLSLELINSVFERMVDSFKPRIHPIVRDIKDIMAGTVFIASLIAAFVGITIFYPYIDLFVRAIIAR